MHQLHIYRGGRRQLLQRRDWGAVGLQSGTALGDVPMSLSLKGGGPMSAHYFRKGEKKATRFQR